MDAFTAFNFNLFGTQSNDQDLEKLALNFSDSQSDSESDIASIEEILFVDSDRRVGFAGFCVIS